MAPLALEEKAQIAHELRTTIRELKDRGLLVASKWACELLAALPKEVRTRAYLPFSPPAQQAGLPRGRQSIMTEMSFESDVSLHIETEEDVLDEDRFELAKTYYDIKEHDRVVATLEGAQSPRARFLRTYSAYLSADRKAQESLGHFLDTKQERHALFPPLNKLLGELEDDTDPYLLYLRGLLHLRLEQREAAVECFVESVKGRPYNWSAWTQLAQLIDSADKFIEIKERLPTGVMRTFFAINVMLDLHTATDLVMTMITELLETFPGSVHLIAQKGMVYYHMRDFSQAEIQFDHVQEVDPFRMEEVDIYSNMLYVVNKKTKLAKLAHQYAEIDRNRPEVCTLIGNYYSSRGDHTRAIQYFKRALMFNRDYLPAWTLMGHEFVELKNTHAAIEAYRKAIDVNAKDYRAWYGLGQAYELLDMAHYAVEYYNQATTLRPYDCRMWTALATVYEHLGRIPDAISAHTRALLGADHKQTPDILAKLAVLNTTEGEPAKAVECHKKILALGIREEAPLAALAGSYLAVAEWESREGGEWALAAQYFEKVAASNLPERDSAADLLRELRIREARATAA
ncbi:hypothetical protein CspHIS471_0703540 [Cutaneotrichosporon sp. HIS471]|nr:hypothetical protein CspHIS471_0703540 [Cutaneotrichosporon sp. HIS471]